MLYELRKKGFEYYMSLKSLNYYKQFFFIHLHTRYEQIINFISYSKFSKIRISNDKILS